MFEGKDVLIFLANAGSGKTTALINQIKEELKVRRPEEIAFVTFTRKGAEEGFSRVSHMFRFKREEIPYFRTLHSLTFHALGYNREQIFTSRNQKEFNRKFGYNLRRFEIEKGDTRLSRDTQYLDYYDKVRSSSLSSKQIAESNIDLDYYNTLVKNYEGFKKEKGKVDFFDCLVNYLKKGTSLPCKVVMIDEAQDITVLQWAVIEKAFRNAEKIYIAGDDKQSLFSYAGARPDILISLADKFPVRHLAESHRIPISVYRLANAITSFIGEKTEQLSVPCDENGEGSITCISDTERLASLINPPEKEKRCADWFILSRNRCFLERVKRSLEDRLIPYWTEKSFFMGGEVMRRIQEYHNFSLEGYKDERRKTAFMKVFGITDFSKPFTDTNLFTEDRKWVYAAYIERWGLTLLEEMCTWKGQVIVSTIHAQKGVEADNVAVLLDYTKRTKKKMFEDLDEELRCLYVAVTRTKRNLFLVSSQSGNGMDDVVTALKNEFHLDF